MAAQKEHHYVPQFFFRNFSRHPQRRTIHVLLTRHRRVIFDAAISKQGKRRKLYLTQKIETAISHIESGMSNCFRTIIDNFTSFPAHRTSQGFIHQMAGAFLLQAGRLPGRGESFHDAIAPMFDELTTSELLADSRTPDDLREELARGDVSIGYDYRYDVLNATHLALLAPVLFFDMSMALLVNMTRVPFVFSDGPAILTNLFLWDSRDIQGIAGYGSRGLIAVMPLCDFLTVLFFDGGTYSLRGPLTTPMFVHSEADVGLLNALQAHAADDAIYFGDKESAEYVERLNDAHRPVSEARVVEVRTAVAADGRSELIHHFEKPPAIRPDFSFIETRRKPTDDDLRLPRNEALMATVERLANASLTRSPAFTQEMFDSAISDSFAQIVDLRERC